MLPTKFINSNTLELKKKLLAIKHQFVLISLQNKPLFWHHNTGNIAFLIWKRFSACSSSSMKIIYSSSWQIEVVYMSYFWKINPSCSNVRCNKKIATSLSHFLHPRTKNIKTRRYGRGQQGQARNGTIINWHICCYFQFYSMLDSNCQWFTVRISKVQVKDNLL